MSTLELSPFSRHSFWLVLHGAHLPHPQSSVQHQHTHDGLILWAQCLHSSPLRSNWIRQLDRLAATPDVAYVSDQYISCRLPMLSRISQLQFCSGGSPVADLVSDSPSVLDESLWILSVRFSLCPQLVTVHIVYSTRLTPLDPLWLHTPEIPWKSLALTSATEPFEH